MQGGFSIREPHKYDLSVHCKHEATCQLQGGGETVYVVFKYLSRRGGGGGDGGAE